jgi:hypothetical protein
MDSDDHGCEPSLALKFYLKRDLDHGTERCVLYEARRHGKAKVGSLKGWRLSVATPYIRKTLPVSHRTQTLDNAMTNTRPLPEEDGVRLALTFLGIRNLKKLGRAENVAREIHAMSQEESYYWYAKALAGRHGSAGIRALRTLFAND